MTSRSGKSGKKPHDESEDYEVLDVNDIGKEAESLMKSLQKYLRQNSHSKQLAVGGVSGWVTGYIAMKIGKTVATALGGSLILIQIANHKGYININWSKVNRDLEGATKKLSQQGKSESSFPQLLDKAASFLDEQAEKAGRVMRKETARTRRWYHKFLHGKQSDGSEAFYMGFVGGSLAGVLTGVVL